MPHSQPGPAIGLGHEHRVEPERVDRPDIVPRKLAGAVVFRRPRRDLVARQRLDAVEQQALLGRERRDRVETVEQDHWRPGSWGYEGNRSMFRRDCVVALLLAMTSLSVIATRGLDLRENNLGGNQGSPTESPAPPGFARWTALAPGDNPAWSDLFKAGYDPRDRCVRCRELARSAPGWEGSEREHRRHAPSAVKYRETPSRSRPAARCRSGTPAARLFRLAGQQRAAHRRVVDRRQQRVGFVARVVGEIDPRIEVAQQAAREHREIDMRRLPRVAASRHRAGLDRDQPESALGVGGDPAEAAETRIERRCRPWRSSGWL